MTMSTYARLRLIPAIATELRFDGGRFSVTFDDSLLRVARDDDNFAVLRLVNQQVSYKATILGGFALMEDRTGEVGYADFFLVDWEDDGSMPELVFQVPPVEVRRRYPAGHSVELCCDCVHRFHVAYGDGVTADFTRNRQGGYDFAYSTGFSGRFWTGEDDTVTLTFKGDLLSSDADAARAQSKFIVSRSKYTGNLLLLLAEPAEVELSMGSC